MFNRRRIIGKLLERVTVTANIQCTIYIGTNTSSYSVYSFTADIPYGTRYTVSVSTVEGYASPSSQTFIAGQSTRSLQMNYYELPTEVIIAVAGDLSEYEGLMIVLNQLPLNGTDSNTSWIRITNLRLDEFSSENPIVIDLSSYIGYYLSGVLLGSHHYCWLPVTEEVLKIEKGKSLYVSA